MRGGRANTAALTERFFEVTRDLTCVADSERIVKANARWTELLGWTADELASRPYMEFVHPADRQATGEGIARLLGGDDLPVFEHRVATSDGSWRVLSWNATLHRETGLILASARDVTDERTSAEERARLEAVLDALREMQASYIASGLDRGWWGMALDRLIALTGSEFGFIGRVSHDDEGAPFLLSYAVTDIAWNEWSRRHFDSFAESGLEFHNLATLFGETLRTGELVISDDPRQDPRSGGLPEGHPPLLTYAGVPLVDDSGMVGMIGLANRPSGFTQDLIDLLAPVTALLSQIISRDAMSERAQTDPLTGLPNRTAFVARAEALFGSGNRRREGAGMLLLDLDGFKQINDTLGHLEGDRILTEVAVQAAATLRDEDMVARLGGDEFAVLLTEGGADDLRSLGLRLRDAIQSLSDSRGGSVRVSIGGTWESADARDGLTWENAYAKADARLYGAKRSGGGTVVIEGE